MDAWVNTYTGKKFSFVNPRPEDICIEDIAHHLSNICRFNGAVREFYSVAQHSILVCNHVNEKNKAWGLLHDAAEAYISDLPSPIKQLSGMYNYRIIENAILECVAERFGLLKEIPDEVLGADLIALYTEAEKLGVNHSGWAKRVELNAPLVLCSPKVAEKMFLNLFYRYVK